MAAKFRGIHHIEIYVRDLKQTRSFWGWLLAELGFELDQDWSAGFSFRLDTAYIVFVQAEAAFLAPPFHRKRCGLNHLAFHGGTRADIDTLSSALKTRGIPILYGEKHPFAGGPDHYAVFFEDPDRLKVEVVANA